MPSDPERCMISAICVLPDGHILILDTNNNKVKLLDQQYQVVSHCGVSDGPIEMCHITPGEVALTVDYRETHEVQFITVITDQIITGRTIQLQHACIGIAHHQGDLFITSKTALYKYSLSGNHISKLYEDESVWKCAVSPRGDKLYIINRNENMLLTLNRNAIVLAPFRDPELKRIGSVHVPHTGQVLVGYGGWGMRFIQVHSEGIRKLTTIITHMRPLWGIGLAEPVCCNSTISCISVGQYPGIQSEIADLYMNSGKYINMRFKLD
ncbi:uncharacterized protein LOC127844361 isoform X2 [Dreissena polymorpha]|uniref:uncharacterized protein LOC127844361 isoform X2 n=1 Tax=Dreissena polymorpha TaxID=45954 RepID=UPI00226457CA|nr:uncharacterized protein LOC127844361 isoform X2 [Dreissena polymorpha]